jgi:hypothetical protein
LNGAVSKLTAPHGAQRPCRRLCLGLASSESPGGAFPTISRFRGSAATCERLLSINRRLTPSLQAALDRKAIAASRTSNRGPSELFMCCVEAKEARGDLHPPFTALREQRRRETLRLQTRLSGAGLFQAGDPHAPKDLPDARRCPRLASGDPRCARQGGTQGPFAHDRGRGHRGVDPRRQARRDQDPLGRSLQARRHPGLQTLL